MYEIIITVDTNDADFETAINEISDADLDLIRPLIAAIKAFQPYKTKDPGSSYDWHHDHNYAFGECRRGDLGEKSPEDLYDFPEEIFELFQDFLPWPEHGFHSIESISISPLVTREELL